MHIRRWVAFGVAAVACACTAQTAPDDTSPGANAPLESTDPVAMTAPPAPARVHGIDPAADAVARAMCDALKKATRFSFHAETTMERAISNGDFVEVPASLDVAVRRPDGLRVERASVRGRRLCQYDGKKIGVLDLDKRLYVSSEAPSTIDATIAALEERFDLVLPLADLAAESPYDSFSEDIADDGVLLGNVMLHGAACDVLLYGNEDITWQVWVAREGPRIPLRLTIRYESEPGVPRFTADFSKWNLDDRTPDPAFTFAPPSDARPVEVVRRSSEETAATATEGK